jgi:hypothetical protein
VLLGDRAVAADCLDTTDALSGENSSTRWEKRADGVRLTPDGPTEARHQKEIVF